MTQYKDVILECKKIKDTSGRGGKKWPRGIVLLIIELLVNGTAPSAILDDLRLTYATLLNRKPKEVPSVDFCRKCRTVCDQFNEAMVGILLARRGWKTLHTDEKSCRQTPFQTMTIGTIDEEDEEDELRNILVSSCIFMETEDAEGCVHGLERKVSC